MTADTRPAGGLRPAPDRPLDDRRRAQVARMLGQAAAIEGQLRDALVLVSERHERDYDVSRTAGMLAGWSAVHLEWLEPIAERYGRIPSERAEKLRAALLGGTRIGSMGQLEDLRDLGLLAEEADATWTILYQGAKELHDQALLTVAGDAREHARRTLRWIRTRIVHAAPETLAVAVDPDREVGGSLPRGLDRIASIPDPVWSPLAGAAALAVAAVGSLVSGTPVLFPSLGPTAALVATEPAAPSSRLWNVVLGHVGGIAAGFASLLLLGATAAPTLFRDQVLVPERAWASVVALAFTILAGIVLRASHPPATATTLLVTLGGIQRLDQVLALTIGVVLVGIAGELIRRVRLERVTPAERRAPPDGRMRAWVRQGTSSVPKPPP